MHHDVSWMLGKAVWGLHPQGVVDFCFCVFLLASLFTDYYSFGGMVGWIGRFGLYIFPLAHVQPALALAQTQSDSDCGLALSEGVSEVQSWHEKPDICLLFGWRGGCCAWRGAALLCPLLGTFFLFLCFKL